LSIIKIVVSTTSCRVLMLMENMRWTRYS